MNEFSKARIKLTGWYLLISILMLVVFNLTAFQAEHQAFSRIENVLGNKTTRPKFTNLLEERLDKFESDFREKLLVFDTLLLIIASLASWFLSARTLKPIEQMVHSQQEFAADVSHELRTPLTTIYMEMEALIRSDKNLSRKYLQVFTNIKDEILRMKRIVDGLLMVVRSDSEISQVNETVNLSQTINHVISQMEATAKQKNIKFSSNIQSGINLKLKSEDQIKQLVLILLDNAIKFTKAEGQVKISLFNNNNRCFLEVMDTGIGIPQEDLSHIFNRFYKGRYHKQTGSGLGLSIAKKIVEANLGKIVVESQLGKGSTFKVVFPS